MKFSIGVNHLYPGDKLPPGDFRWGKFSRSFHQEANNIDSLIAAVRQGFAFSPVMKDGHRSQANFVSAQHIALDSDTGDVRSSLDALTKDPFIAEHAAFLYTTHSSTPEHPRARVVFILDSPITDRAVYRLAQRALAWKYPFTDQSVAEESRFFYGAVGCEVRRLGKILPYEVLKNEVIRPYLVSLRDQADNPERAWHIPDENVLGKTPAERYVSRAVQEEAAWLASRAEGTGERHRGLLIAAIKLQSLRLAEWLPESVRDGIDLYAILLPAAMKNGYVKKYGEAKARETIADGVSYALPRARPNSWRAEATGAGVGESEARGNDGTEEPTGTAREQRASAADRAVEYVLAAGVELFHDQYGEAFITFCNAQGRREVWPLKSKAVSDFIRWTFYSHESKGLAGESLATAKGTLAAHARFKGECKTLSVRVAYHDGAYWYDLGDWRAVSVSSEGWRVVDMPPVLFRHYPHQAVQAEPKREGTLDGFLALLNVRDINTKLMVTVYLVAGLIPGIPLPVLIIFGEHGSAKSTKFRLLRALLDPSVLKTLSVPESPREFVQLAAHHRTVYLDNLSSLPGWLSDAFCRLCTGDGFSKRELYSDDDDVVYSFQGLGGINGINLVATRPDLLDRGILLKLEPIPEGERLTEAEVWARFRENQPYALGAMLDALARAMVLRPGVKLPRSPRLADFAHWGAAISEALGYTRQEFLEAYGINVASQNEAALEDSLVAQAILGFIQMGEEWTGTASQLLEVLTPRAEILGINVKDRSWPKAPNALSKRLHEMAPNLRRVGIEVSEKRAGGVKTWSLYRHGGEKIAPIGHTATSKADLSVPGGGTPSTHRGPRPTHQTTSSTPQTAVPKANCGDGVDGVGVSPTLTGPRTGMTVEDDDEGVV
jgi:hypothetical protein